MPDQKQNIGLEQKQEEAIYPEAVKDCEVKIYLNGYLIKTVYSIEDDQKAFLNRIKADEKGQIKETEIIIVLTRGKQKKEININGLLRQVFITAWQDVP
jgi:hypothetical protein